MRLRLLIGFIWMGTLAGAFWIGRFSVSPKSPEPEFPSLKVVTSEVKNDSALYTLRNIGSTGEVLIFVSQENRTWTFQTIFNVGEERQISVHLPGLQPNHLVYFSFVPVAQASPSQLQGARTPK